MNIIIICGQWAPNNVTHNTRNDHSGTNEGSGGPAHPLSFASLDTDNVEVQDGDAFSNQK